MTGILVVCTANICRSPVAEAALGTALVGTGLPVSSAGTHAEDGGGPDPAAAAFVRRELGIRLGHRTRLLRPAHVDGADLVITMTTAQRSLVAGTAPRAVRRTFTLRELARISELLPPGERYRGLRELALRCARLRPAVAAAPAELDVEDPYGGSAAAYATSFGQILVSAEVVAAAIRRRVPAADAAGTP